MDRHVKAARSASSSQARPGCSGGCSRGGQARSSRRNRARIRTHLRDRQQPRRGLRPRVPGQAPLRRRPQWPVLLPATCRWRACRREAAQGLPVGCGPRTPVHRQLRLLPLKAAAAVSGRARTIVIGHQGHAGRLCVPLADGLRRPSALLARHPGSGRTSSPLRLADGPSGRNWMMCCPARRWCPPGAAMWGQRRGNPTSASRPAARHHCPAVGAGRPGGRLGGGRGGTWPMPVAAIAAAAAARRGAPSPRPGAVCVMIGAWCIAGTLIEPVTDGHDCGRGLRPW